MNFNTFDTEQFVTAETEIAASPARTCIWRMKIVLVKKNGRTFTEFTRYDENGWAVAANIANTWAETQSVCRYLGLALDQETTLRLNKAIKAQLAIMKGKSYPSVNLAF